MVGFLPFKATSCTVHLYRIVWSLLHHCTLLHCSCTTNMFHIGCVCLHSLAHCRQDLLVTAACCQYHVVKSAGCGSFPATCRRSHAVVAVHRKQDLSSGALPCRKVTQQPKFDQFMLTRPCSQLTELLAPRCALTHNMIDRWTTMHLPGLTLEVADLTKSYPGPRAGRPPVAIGPRSVSTSCLPWPS